MANEFRFSDYIHINISASTGQDRASSQLRERSTKNIVSDVVFQQICKNALPSRRNKIKTSFTGVV